jgi:hypothetical protein
MVAVLVCRPYLRDLMKTLSLSPINQLVVNNAAEENQKAKILYSVLLECPYRSSVQKMYPDHEITLFGLTVGDLRYCEGEEGWPQTLFNKMINKENDRQFDISDISDGAITIDHHFREKFKDGEWTDDGKSKRTLYAVK